MGFEHRPSARSTCLHRMTLTVWGALNCVPTRSVQFLVPANVSVFGKDTFADLTEFRTLR